ncbi:Bmt6 beta-mannosyltransferase [Candida orthopsilosis Co 90-125]|uniref:Bmt6 beta-mannosyltransferase n=1 Tax=Candida orthopsilosis (strain 90-125) TaxID=1136231 RepID=H8X8K5_CANO9|nr:Bmt6 beta-mannosyltransferase [Candida orthopsilosis Co 90-125]CCG24480.1 Bmt6 beta-mannosyltransferase [Candida orthopsilosis Co 90-125]
MVKSGIRWFRSISRRFLIIVVIVLLAIFPIHLLFRNADKGLPLLGLISSKKPLLPKTSSITNDKNSLPQAHLHNHNSQQLLVFPQNFKDEATYKQLFPVDNKQVINYSGNNSALTFDQLKHATIPHRIHLFNSFSKSKQCSQSMQSLDLTISENFIFDADFKSMVEILQQQLKTDDAFKHLDGFFQGKLPTMLEKNTIGKHFYKFAGTSVWLKEYGVHLMVSRVLFSRRGLKWNPQISLLYAQVYDVNWQELINVELVVPVMDTDGVTRINQNLKFPRFLPIPYYFDYHYTKRRWYGPEDTRIMLIENEMQKEEPVIIFNAHQRNIHNYTVVDEDKSMQINFEFHRAMFIGWPFRYQLGKVNTDGISDSRFDNVKFTRVKELRIAKKNRKGVEKNWTPFIIPKDRDPKFPGDKYIYLIYQWDNLEVLKCELQFFQNSEDESKCQFVYKAKKSKKQGKVGPIRGGTEMIPYGSIDPTYKDKNVWIGFLRAHIKHCGCGRSMYRPNFYIFTKSETSDEFQVQYLSSSISFSIPVSGWRKHEVQCAARDPNVLIPNGISSWEYDPVTKQDVLGLTLSVADENNSILYIYGLKGMVKDLLNQQELAQVATGGVDGVDGNNELLMKCVLDASIEFCKAYGDEQTKLGVTEEVLKKLEEEKKKLEEEKKNAVEENKKLEEGVKKQEEAKQ